MKKIIALFGLVLLIASCSNNPTGNLQIQGNIKGLKKGTLYLQQLQDSTMVALDSIELNGDGNFMFDTKGKYVHTTLSRFGIIANDIHVSYLLLSIIKE